MNEVKEVLIHRRFNMSTITKNVLNMENSADLMRRLIFGVSSGSTLFLNAPYLYLNSRNCFINQFRQTFLYDEIHVPKSSWVMEKFFATRKDVL